MSNLESYENVLDMATAMASEVETTEVAKPKLARMEAECRFLAVLLESGVEKWEGYPLALDTYRSEGNDDA